MTLLTAENYYSPEANYEYMSVSQYKSFVGTYGFPGCEAKAMAEIAGTYDPPMNDAMMIGSYVDRYFEGTLNEFREEHPEIFRSDGMLRSQYRMADRLIDRVEQDELFMTYMSGKKQTIMTAEIFGTPWKVKIDSYVPTVAIVDLKVMRSLKDIRNVDDLGPIDFVRYWGYDIQGAVYQEVVRQNTGLTLPFFIAGISKENPPDFDVIHVSDVYLREALKGVERNIGHVLDVKYGREEPTRCETCAYCKSTKVLKAPIEISDLMAAI